MKTYSPLQKGDTIAFIAPARWVKPEELLFAKSLFFNWGFNILEGKNLYKIENQFAGSDAERAEDLEWALLNPEIKAIFCVRGGYGCTRALRMIDFKNLTQVTPKLLIGYSDITAIHFALQKLNWQSVHFSMPSTFENVNQKSAKDLTYLHQILLGNKINYPLSFHIQNKNGIGKGKLIGGNLSIILHIVHTEYDFDWENCILFIEDIDEYLYQIDRMLVHLAITGKLKKLKGIIVGHFTDTKDNTILFGKTVEEIILQNCIEYTFPIVFGFEAGHSLPNLPLLLGAEATLDVSNDLVTIKI